ncbi:MAG: lamin tail domain-containing protein, partial [Myxococcales bacterium]|nr:lamin tail domain-containing protein [Myxococcales bacterium]
TWTYCDRAAGAGADGAEDGYQPANAGQLTSTPGPCDANPCAEAPPADCADAFTVATFVAPGECAVLDGAAECSFERDTVDCRVADQICADGACVDAEARPGAGDIVITEIMYDPHDPLDDVNAEWIELHNPTDGDLRLDGCTLADAANQNTLGRLVVPAGGYVLLGRSDDLDLNGGLVFDALFDFGLNNGGETISLTCEDTLIDTVTYDDGGDFPDAQRASLSLDPASTDADANDAGARWCLGQMAYFADGAPHLGSPGLPNPACPVPDAEIDWCRFQFPPEIRADAGSQLTAFGLVYEAGITDRTDATDVDPGVRGQAGFGPEGQPDDAWTWVDAQPNPAWNAAARNEPNNDEYQATFTVPAPGAYHMAYRFSRDGGATWKLCDLTGSDDGYAPANAARLTSLASPCEAEACEAPPAATCDADGLTRLTYAAPGVCNVVGGAAECTYAAARTDCSLDGGVCVDGACRNGFAAPAAGEVIFTEIMYDPHGDLQDSQAEWFELHNRADTPRTLHNCVVADGANEAPVVGLNLEAGAYAVFARSADPEVNGGLVPDHLFPFGLNNDGEPLTLRCGGVEIDTVTYDVGGAFPAARQASLSLDPAFTDAAANDDGASWCLGQDV